MGKKTIYAQISDDCDVKVYGARSSGVVVDVRGGLRIHFMDREDAATALQEMSEAGTKVPQEVISALRAEVLALRVPCESDGGEI